MVLPSPIRWMEGEIAGSKPLGCLCNLPIKKKMLDNNFLCWTMGNGAFVSFECLF